MAVFAPLLAAKIETTKGEARMAADFAKVRFPAYISPKIDGIRSHVQMSLYSEDRAEALSRSMKLIPNAATQARLGLVKLVGLDGELFVGAPTDPNLMQQTNSGVMSTDGDPDVQYYVFDNTNLDAPFHIRYEALKARVLALREAGLTYIHLVPHVLVNNREELEAAEQQFIAEGYEGIMIRDPDGRYKQGRSTLNEGILIKLKRFDDGEAVIISVYEQMENQNEATKDALGHTKRSSSKEGKVGKDTYGGAVVRDLVTGIEFKIGAGKGLTIEERARRWAIRDQLPGQILKYQFFNVGVKEKPRFPGDLGFRNPIDM